MLLKWPKTMSPITPLARSLAEADGKRLVVVVLANEDDPLRAVPRRHDALVVLHPQEGRLLDDDVLARLERPEGQIEVKPGRDRDDNRVHARVVDGRRVFLVAPGASEPAAQLRRARRVAAGIAADNVGLEGAQIPAVYPRDEATAQKRDAQR